MPDDPWYEHGTLMDITDSLKVLETSLIFTAVAHVVFIIVANPDGSLACMLQNKANYESVNMSYLAQSVLSYLCMYSSMLFHITKVKFDFTVPK
jgi:hypothetical protein